MQWIAHAGGLFGTFGDGGAAFGPKGGAFLTELGVPNGPPTASWLAVDPSERDSSQPPYATTNQVSVPCSLADD